MRFTALMLIIVLAFGPGLTPSVTAQVVDPDDAALVDRPISQVVVTGLSRVSEPKVRNQLRTAAGTPFNRRTVTLDVESLFRLGDFRDIFVRARILEDGTVRVIFELTEQPLLADVQVVGNRVVSDQELLRLIPLAAGAPRDDYLINNARASIREVYRERGYFLAEVHIDEAELDRTSILLFRIVEGPRVRIREIAFEGNDSFRAAQLRGQIDTRTAIPLLRKGRLDQDLLLDDVAAIDRFYKERGYLDVRVDRRIELSPDNREARVTFVIAEGRLYTMRDIRVEGAQQFDRRQIAALLEVKSGDVYSRDRLRKSLRILQDTYGQLGFPDVQVDLSETRPGPEPQVDLHVLVREGRRAVTGNIEIQGNFLTQDKVIRRELSIAPNRPLDMTQVDASMTRLRALRLFNDVTITLQPEQPNNPYRDVLVEIREANTGSFNFGVAFGSDAGVFGDFSVQQRNFDIFDFPESFTELIRGRAFRGAGQNFSLNLQPGDQVSTFSVSLTEPHLFETPLSLRLGGFFRQRRFRDYDEERMNASIRLSRRLGDIWSIGAGTRFARVDLTDIDPDAPQEIFDSRGPNNITGLSVNLTRSTVGTIVRPGRGTVFEVGYEQLGALGGDLDFGILTADWTGFFTLNEDFLGRRSILRLNSRVGYLVDGNDAPVYERFYLGGRSFRGFDFRTISPKGRREDGTETRTSVGGEWMLFLGAQYEFPIFEDVITGVAFVDSGTVSDSVGFDDYRVSVGFGLRLYIAALGPVPIALDFGFPLREATGDRRQLFSFSAELPF